jgi:gas vesicle protein
MARDEGGSGAVFLAFVLGAMTGAALALLWAPTTGEEARKYLGDRAREGADKGRDFLDRQRDTVSQAIERGKEAYRQARNEAEPAGGQETL